MSQRPEPFELQRPGRRPSPICASASRARAFPTRRRASPGPTAPTSPTCASWSPTGATASTGARRRRGSTPSRSSRCRCTASTCISCTCRARGRDPCPLLLLARLAGLGVRVPRAHPAADRPGALRRRSGRRLHRRRAVAARLRPVVRARASRASRVEEIADCFAELMTDVLGYRRFGAQGGDWGAFVAVAARLRACRPAGRHPPQPAAAPPRPGDGRRPDARGARATSTSSRVWLKEETGYQWIQGTRPQTLAFGADRLAGRPRRLDRREVPRLVRLRRRRRDRCSPRTSCSPTSASTGSPARSARRSGRTTRACTGRGRSRTARRSTCRPATAEFPREILRPPRSLAERTYTDIRRWTRDAARRPLRRDGAAGGAGPGDPRVLPAAARLTLSRPAR